MQPVTIRRFRCETKAFRLLCSHRSRVRAGSDTNGAGTGGSPISLPTPTPTLEEFISVFVQ